MKLNLLVLLLCLFQSIVFAQDKKVMKIAKYLEKGKGSEAKELLDELDNIKTYQTDIYYWYVRTVYYRNIALDKPNTSNELAEARKSFEKLVELDKTDVEKSFTEYIPQFKKDLFEGKNKITKAESKSSTESANQSNDGKTVTLTLIGQGKTKDAAKFNALRNALEKAFGAFISSNTSLLNDELIKDEIVSVSSGNIQNFEILSETQMSDGSYSSVVKATVSIGKLTKFCENKGISVEFKGGLFAANIKLQNLQTKNEYYVLNHLAEIVNSIAQKGLFDYNISVSEPKRDFDVFEVKISITCTLNENFAKIQQIIKSTLESIQLSSSEIEFYAKSNLGIYHISRYPLRDMISVLIAKQLFEEFIPRQCLNFKLSNGVSEKSGLQLLNLIKSSEVLYYNRLDGKRYEFEAIQNPIQFNYNISKINIESFKNTTLENINNLTFESKKYTSIDSKDAHFNINLEYFKENKIIFNLVNRLTLEEIEKITEYKVQPINK
jgi:hypothetical protein